MGGLIGNFLRGLVGGKESDAPSLSTENAVEYKGFMIHPAARREGAQWLTVGVITKQVGDEVKEHHFIRADMYSSKEGADDCAVTKGRQIIDEQGDKLFQDA